MALLLLERSAVLFFHLRRSVLAGLAFALPWFGQATCVAQDLNPRAYIVSPVSANAVILSYGYSSGDVLFDPTLPIADATARIHTPVASLYHAFDFFGRSANVSGGLPFAVGDLQGKLSGEQASTHRAGMADPVVRLSVNLWGGPALTPAEFVKAAPRRAVLGVSVKAVMPLGQYDHVRYVNLSANRWAIKPELGYMARVGPFIVDAYGGFWLFGANTDFAASSADTQGSRRTQDPIGTFESHVSYDVTRQLWISADINYWRGGRTSVNGVRNEDTLQSNSRFGVTGSLPLTSHQSLKVSYSDGMVVRLGGKFRIINAAWQYAWLGIPLRKAQ